MKNYKKLSLEQLNHAVGGAYGGNDWRWSAFIPTGIKMDDSAFQFKFDQKVCGNGVIINRDYVTRTFFKSYQRYTVAFYDDDGNEVDRKEMWQNEIWY